MDYQEIDKIIAATKQVPSAIEALLTTRSNIDAKLQELGYDASIPVPCVQKPKIGRPKGSKSRAKEPIQIPVQIAEAFRELDEDEQREAAGL